MNESIPRSKTITGTLSRRKPGTSVPYLNPSGSRGDVKQHRYLQANWEKHCDVSDRSILLCVWKFIMTDQFWKN